VKNGIKISVLALVVLFLVGCRTSSPKKTEESTMAAPQPVASMPAKEPAPAQPVEVAPDWTVDRKGFRTKPMEIEVSKEGQPYLPVGAEIVSKGAPVKLIDVIKKMADLQGFSVSWADDTEPETTVNVHIRPADNFWDALRNLLRQKDYFYEQSEETLVIRYKETRRYQLVMPLLEETFRTSLGGDLIGGTAADEGGEIDGNMQLEGNIPESINFWANVKENLESIIEDKGSFITDDHIGEISVTAPRMTHEKVASYLANLKEQIYRQVVIEAKIVEVRLNDESNMGVDWSNILRFSNRNNNETLGGVANFGESYQTTSAGVVTTVAGEVIYPTHKFLKFITMRDFDFSIMVDALKDYGSTNLLSKPKLTIMNGHGATITVGEKITYIKEVETTTDENGNITYTTESASILSGFGLAVLANIVDDEDVVLYIVPVTSELQPAPDGEDVEYRFFGEGQIGLPRVRLRELSTMARIKDGETLIIGGHIDKTEGNTKTSVPLLGNIPGLGWLFKHEGKSVNSRELVIFLTPKIVAASE